jgi:chorismate mutase
MDNRINEIRRKISTLRTGMARIEAIMRDQINRDQDCTDTGMRLMTMRAELASLIAELKAAGGVNPLPTVEERLRANYRPPLKPKVTSHR